MTYDFQLEESALGDEQDDEKDDDPPELVRLVNMEERNLLPKDEEVEEINVGTIDDPKVLKVGSRMQGRPRLDLIELLREFKDVFAWSYQDMPGLSDSIVVHKLPIMEECKPVK